MQPILLESPHMTSAALQMFEHAIQDAIDLINKRSRIHFPEIVPGPFC